MLPKDVLMAPGPRRGASQGALRALALALALVAAILVSAAPTAVIAAGTPTPARPSGGVGGGSRFGTPVVQPTATPVSNSGGFIPTARPTTFAPAVAGTRSSSSGGGSAIGVVLVIVILIGVVALIGFLAARRSPAGVAAPAASTAPPGSPRTNDLAELSIALLSTARDVPTALDRIVTGADTASAHGLFTLAQDVNLLLQRHKQYWHGAAYRRQRVAFGDAESGFNRLTMQARARLSDEAITNLNGRLRTESAPAAGEADGTPAAALPPGDYTIVTLVLSATAAPEASTPLSAEAVQAILEGIGGIAENDLYAFEVIWQPTNPDQSLSRDDLLGLYSEIAPV